MKMQSRPENIGLLVSGEVLGASNGNHAFWGGGWLSRLSKAGLCRGPRRRFNSVELHHGNLKRN